MAKVARTPTTWSVNAYAMEYDDYGYGYYVLDFPDDHLDLHAAAREPDPALGQRSVTTINKTKTSPALGMLDTGATCSAGPESSIKNMFNALLQQDKSAKITLDGKSCPRFRYGSRIWGRALYRLTMESVVFRLLHCLILLKVEPWFSESMLVPVLIGMDFIDTHGMIIDFNDGTAVCANHDDGEPFQLPRNSKKHLMVDIVDFLTMGQQCVQGPPNIHVILNESSGSEQFAAELMLSSCNPFDFPELCPLLIESGELDNFCDLQTSSSSTPSQWFCRLWERRLMLNCKMGGSISTALRSSTSLDVPWRPKVLRRRPTRCAHWIQRGPYQQILETPG
jgi:hypothetical protein